MLRQHWSYLALVAVLPLLLPATATPTVWQQQLFKNVARKAGTLAEVARPSLLKSFDEPFVREVLHHCCQHLADAPAATLLRRREFYVLHDTRIVDICVANLVHGPLL
eukprot:6188807-Pleurochrysis_carterae.AAC.3